MSTKVPSVSNNMSTIKNLAKKKVSKKVKFMGEDITIYKMSVELIMELQDASKALENDSDNFDVLKKIVRDSVEGGEELDEDDFQHFPLDDLSKLSTEILKFSGIDTGKSN